jgi:DNA polymerase III subunit beta
MDLRIERTVLLRALAQAKSVADARSQTLPILSHVLLRAEKGRLQVAASDLMTSISADASAEVAKDGALTVEARAIHEIVKSLPEGKVALTAKSAELAIVAGKASFSIRGLSARDFPKLPAADESAYVAVDATALRDLIEKTAFAASDDPGRPHLCGCLFEARAGVARMVATDGHRLAKAERPWNGPTVDPGVIIPRKGLIEVERLLRGEPEKCELGLAKGHLFVRAEGATLAAKLADATFPPWDQVVPKENGKHATVKRQALLEAVKRVSLVASNGSRGILLNLRDRSSLVLRSDNPDLGEASEVLDAACEGEPITVGFNARYLAEPLEAMASDDVHLELSGELEPGLLRPAGTDGDLCVVMPMRI